MNLKIYHFWPNWFLIYVEAYLRWALNSLLPITDHLLWGPAVALIREKTECFWFEARQAKKTLIPYWKKLFCFLNHCSSIWEGEWIAGGGREGGRETGLDGGGGAVLRNCLFVFRKILLILIQKFLPNHHYCRRLKSWSNHHYYRFQNFEKILGKKLFVFFYNFSFFFLDFKRRCFQNTSKGQKTVRKNI